MAVQWDRGSKANEGPLVADRNLYLDRSGTKLVEEGHADSASQLAATGHPIDAADVNRLGLVDNNGRIEQDRETKKADIQKVLNELETEKKAFYEKVEQYKRENATKEIPNTMEAARVELETRWEHANLALAQFIKEESGKDPLRGESQATSVEPEKSQVAKDATKSARSAVAKSPSPQELAASAPTRKAEVAPQRTAAAPVAPAAPASKTAARTAASKTASSRAAAKKGRSGK